MSPTSTEPGFHELVIPGPLWDFLTFCEIYCAASCCEDAAFEQHHSLIRRKIIDMNLEGIDGMAQFDKANDQLYDVVLVLEKIKPETEFDQVLIWAVKHTGLHNFQLGLDIAPGWFHKWQEVFDEVTKPK